MTKFKAAKLKSIHKKYYQINYNKNKPIWLNN